MLYAVVEKKPLTLTLSPRRGNRIHANTGRPERLGFLSLGRPLHNQTRQAGNLPLLVGEGRGERESSSIPPHFA